MYLFCSKKSMADAAAVRGAKLRLKRFQTQLSRDRWHRTMCVNAPLARLEVGLYIAGSLRGGDPVRASVGV